jgi:hypothetical protein
MCEIPLTALACKLPGWRECCTASAFLVQLAYLHANVQAVCLRQQQRLTLPCRCRPTCATASTDATAGQYGHL